MDLPRGEFSGGTPVRGKDWRQRRRDIPLVVPQPVASGQFRAHRWPGAAILKGVFHIALDVEDDGPYEGFEL